MLVMSISTHEELQRATLWLFGDLSMSDWQRIPYGGALVLAGLLLSLSRAKALNALILGDELAHSLGFTPLRERLVLFIAVGLLTGASVSLGGTIGFIGLLMPHIMRYFLGADSRMLIPASAIGGGALLCIADLISRSVLPPMELPAGVITAILGAPYFLYLLRRKNVLSI
jgi:iron complex transport system permease protein